MPVGIGARYKLNDSFSLYTEASYHIMSTDYLDGFSQSANPALKDHYYKYSAGLIYSGKQKNRYGCPVVSY